MEVQKVAFIFKDLFFDLTNSQDQKKIPWKKKLFLMDFFFPSNSFFGLVNFQGQKMKSLKEKKSNLEKWIKMISKVMKKKKTH